INQKNRSVVMPLKLVAHELSAPGRSSQIAAVLGQIGEVVRLTSSTFVVDTPLGTAEMLKKLMKVVDLEDDVYVLELSSFWSGYGTVTVNQFLTRHMPGEKLTSLTC